ncbi:DUF3185 family protein [Marinobacter alexandrii]|uniref:DUF3185 family protein n=3 Tax=Marinobacteraceae TaxID=2887365 RepID=UPI0032973EB6
MIERAESKELTDNVLAGQSLRCQAPRVSRRYIQQAPEKEHEMGSSKLVGVVLLVVGIALLFFGYQSTQSVGGQITETFTGQYTDKTMWFLIGGAAAAAAGAFLTFFRK